MRMLAAFIALLAFSGCAFHGSRGDLSDAMESSASGTSGRHRDRHDGRSNQFESDGFLSSLIGAMFSGDSNSSGSSSASWMGDDDEPRLHMPMDVSYLVPLNGDMKGITRFSITPLALEDQRNLVGVYLGGGLVKFERDSLPDRAVDNASIFELGLTYRRYFNDPFMLWSPYFAANLAWQPLYWSYRNSVASGSEIIDSDRLHGFNGYAGLGMTLWRGEVLSLFSEAGFGGTLYWKNTNEGFRNDVFDDFGYFAIKAGFTFRF